ncbi:MAG: hypothetical protein QXI58_02225 [Candidatus Micrarchaeia archaeon]
MYNKKIFNKFLKEVVSKVERSSIKYKDAYLLNDMRREWNEELVDLVGWVLMQAVRMKEVVENRIKRNDLVFFDEFFKNQDTSFLKFLKQKIDKELKRRESK